MEDSSSKAHIFIGYGIVFPSIIVPLLIDCFGVNSFDSGLLVLPLFLSIGYYISKTLTLFIGSHRRRIFKKSLINPSVGIGETNRINMSPWIFIL